MTIPEPIAAEIIVENKINVQKLWSKYEDIAMHFNDLLMRLRTQALAGIAAISTLVGIFTKAGTTEIQSDWLIATFIFLALGALWIAIALLDILYYNRLLMGAVGALLELEEDSRLNRFSGINMSTKIDGMFSQTRTLPFPRFYGVLAFYVIVFVVIMCGAALSYHMRCSTSA